MQTRLQELLALFENADFHFGQLLCGVGRRFQGCEGITRFAGKISYCIIFGLRGVIVCHVHVLARLAAWDEVRTGHFFADFLVAREAHIPVEHVIERGVVVRGQQQQVVVLDARETAQQAGLLVVFTVMAVVDGLRTLQLLRQTLLVRTAEGHVQGKGKLRVTYFAEQFFYHGSRAELFYHALSAVGHQTTSLHCILEACLHPRQGIYKVAD